MKEKLRVVMRFIETRILVRVVFSHHKLSVNSFANQSGISDVDKLETSRCSSSSRNMMGFE